MTIERERANFLLSTAKQYLELKPLLIEEDQPRVTCEIDQKKDQLNQILLANINPKHIAEGKSLKQFLTNNFPIIRNSPRVSIITNGVILAFEQLHPEEEYLASPQRVLNLVTTVNNQLNTEEMPGLPGLLQLHGFLHAIEYIIENY